jgi:outer membrane protein OmpA-like peptidoglycan-associated protein
MNWLWWVIGLAVLAFLAWWWFSSRNPEATESATAEAAASAAASEVGTDLAAAPKEGDATVVIPQGAGVTSELRDGKPVVKVYFDSGKTDVTTAFAATAGGLKSWLDTHSGTTLAVSGYSDPSGNAKANADLAKQRAQAVQSALVAAGIPATRAALVKPEQVIDAGAAKDAARRVEVVVK